MLLETFEMLNLAFGYKVLSRAQTHEWYKCFKEGQTSVVNCECSGQISISKYEENIQKLWKVIRSNGRWTVCEVAEEAGVSKTMHHMILTENFGMHHVAAKFVPCSSNEDRKQNRAIVSKELVNCANADENFLKHCYR